ncbi:serine protease [Maritimibacter sp. HL-12]|uniref:trypsin-like serine peptidase n=1 Tax=Maritimibacter sp. HL-12 TaxID=1162418 RepID=UPI000A0F38F3|nr:trypsin-like peptidase domain-containing protein [Maritimibacter sp. HL-12]SMH50109.1 protease YdgD [Maritimibacter sp. HL-12]
MRVWASRLLVSVGVALAAPALADNTGLDRLTLRSDLLGWEAVGRLDLGDGFCTGVLVAPDLVLTAAHCLTTAQAEGRVDRLRFRAGLRDGEAVAEAGVARAVMHPDYLPGVGVSAENIRHDVGLVQLATPIPAGVAAPFQVENLPRAGAAVSVVSYASGRAEAPARQAVCTVLGRQSELMAFDCDVTFGASGAPVFDLAGRRARIVSLISSGGVSGADAIAFGMELPARFADLKHALRTGAGVFPETTFGARRVTVGERGATGARFVRP